MSDDSLAIARELATLNARIEAATEHAKDAATTAENTGRDLIGLTAELKALKEGILQQAQAESNTPVRTLFKNPIFVTVFGLIVCFAVGAVVFKIVGKDAANGAAKITNDFVPKNEFMGPVAPPDLTHYTAPGRVTPVRQPRQRPQQRGHQ